MGIIGVDNGITDDIVKKYWDTHTWKFGIELPICINCGKTPISLGIWGDNNWRDKHRGWEKPCKGIQTNERNNSSR